MKKYFMPAMAAFIFILLFSLHIHASEPSAPADGYSKQISENSVMQEDESESEPETAETVPPPKNMAIFQEPDTQPPETETACGLDGLDGLDGKILCSYDSGGNYDSFAAYTLNYGEDTSELIDTIKNFTFYIGWTEPFNVYKSFSLYAEWTVYTGTAQDGDGGMPLSPESLDSTVPGTYQVKGTLILPKGCQWKDGFIPPVPVIPISILENGEKKLLTRLNDADFSYYLQPALYEVNSSYYSYDLESLPEYALTFTEDYSSAVMLDTHWDYSAVDISRPGTYTAHVQLTLPETYQQEYSLDPSLETCSKTIYVRAPGTLCLYVQYIDIRFAGDWLEPLEEASIIPYYLTSEKELTDTELENSHFIPCTDNSLFDFFPSHFCVYRDALDPYTHYYFKIYYKGRESNILHILDDGESPTVTYVDGNRDGGDSEQQTKPPITQPAPDIPDTPPAQDTASGSVAVPDTEPFFMAPQDIQEPATELPVETESPEGQPANASISSGQPSSDKNEPSVSPHDSAFQQETESPSENNSRQEIRETVTRDTTVLSAARLKILSGSYPDFIPFEHNGILLRLPSSWLEEQIPEDDSLFSVTLLRPSEETFRIVLSVDGKELTDLPASHIMLPIEDTVSSYRLMHETGCVSEGLAAKDGFLSFTVTKTGDYRLEKEDVPVREESEEPSRRAVFIRLLFIAAAVLFLLAAVTFIVRKKGGGRYE